MEIFDEKTAAKIVFVIQAMMDEKGVKAPQMEEPMGGTSNQQIYRLLHGQRRLTSDWLQRFANALETTPQKILNKASVQKKNKNESEDTDNDFLQENIIQAAYSAWAEKTHNLKLEKLAKLTRTLTELIEEEGSNPSLEEIKRRAKDMLTIMIKEATASRNSPEKQPPHHTD